MDNATRRMLNDAEQGLLRDCAPAKLRKLDEDALVELHTRVRRARNKYSKLYRRRASERVRKDRGRAVASAAHQRSAVKAEVPTRASKQAGKSAGRPVAKRRTPVSKRASASSRAATRRHQAKRAAR